MRTKTSAIPLLCSFALCQTGSTKSRCRHIHDQTRRARRQKKGLRSSQASRSPCVVLPALSAVDTDVQRNVQLLKDRSWFDIPIVYTNGARAILAMEKGSPDDHAFTEAFAAWSGG